MCICTYQQIKVYMYIYVYVCISLHKVRTSNPLQLINKSHPNPYTLNKPVQGERCGVHVHTSSVGLIPPLGTCCEVILHTLCVHHNRTYLSSAG